MLENNMIRFQQLLVIVTMISVKVQTCLFLLSSNPSSTIKWVGLAMFATLESGVVKLRVVQS
jgi:hypothetical protein